MSDAAYGNTELVATKAELVAAVVQRELIEAAKIAPRCMDVSSFCVPGAQSIDFPKAGSLTVLNRTEGSAGDAAAITYGVDTMSLSFNAYVAWIIDYKSSVQSAINVQLETAARAARAHADYLDVQLLAEIESVGSATTTAGAISYAITLEMMQTYLSRNGDTANASWAVGPGSWAALMNIDEFKRADVYGSSPIPSGVIGKIHGVDVVMSSKISSANTFYLFEKDAVAFGLQTGPSYSEQGANEFGSQAKRAVLDQIFGVKGMFIAQEGASAGKSALVIKDNN